MVITASSTAQRLGSVATRWRHPLVSDRRLYDGKSGISSTISRQNGGEEKVDNQLSRLEAVLFLSQQPQTSRKLAQLASLADGTKARTLIRTLNRRYDTEERAFLVEEVAGGFQLMTRPKFAPWLRRLHTEPVEIRLSTALMETLAVVAYRQPVLRAEIEAVRGVQSGEVLRQLIERDMVRIVGRSEELGRPYLYGTTKQFLQIFGLRHLDELPRAEILRNQGPLSADQENTQTVPHSNTSNQSQDAEEEENVTTLIARTNRKVLAETECVSFVECHDDDRTDSQTVLTSLDDKDEELEDEDIDDEEDDDEDDDFEDDEFDDDEEDDEDLDDEPWEEVEDDDEWEEDDDDEWDDDEWDDDEDEEEEEEEDI